MTSMSVSRKHLLSIYRRLLRRRGHAGWWPGETAFEVCLGAILVQHTAWPNAERALTNLRQAGLLSYEALRDVPVEALADLVRPAGCFNVKARRLRALLGFLGTEYGGDVAAMGREKAPALRRKLLAVPGIGRETADSIILYAAGLPVFVVDAYTRRVFGRLGLLRGTEAYDDIQAFFMSRLPPDRDLYNDYHAQIVLLGKDVCRPRPRCAGCVLDRVCAKRGVGEWTGGRQADAEREVSA
jgi:endonuclease III related protein